MQSKWRISLCSNSGGCLNTQPSPDYIGKYESSYLHNRTEWTNLWDFTQLTRRKACSRSSFWPRVYCCTALQPVAVADAQRSLQCAVSTEKERCTRYIQSREEMMVAQPKDKLLIDWIFCATYIWSRCCCWQFDALTTTVGHPICWKLHVEFRVFHHS